MGIGPSDRAAQKAQRWYRERQFKKIHAWMIDCSRCKNISTVNAGGLWQSGAMLRSVQP